jgi:hypothetical protein
LLNKYGLRNNNFFAWFITLFGDSGTGKLTLPPSRWVGAATSARKQERSLYVTQLSLSSYDAMKHSQRFYLVAQSDWKRKIQEKLQASAEKNHSIHDVQESTPKL